MSLSKIQQDDLFGLQNTMKDLLPSDHEMYLFSKEIYPIFNDNDFKEFYSDKGRNGISPAFLSMVTMLQWKESLSDEETTEAVMFRLDWKYALHLPLDKAGTFDASTLCVFRKRLRNHDQESLVFDKLLKLCQEKGFVKKHTKQRVDATHIVKHINRITTTDLLFRTVKCAVEEVEKKDPLFYENNIPIDIQERYEKKFSSFGMSKESRGDKQAEIVEDGFRLKKILQESNRERTLGLKQIEIMETIFRENVTIREKVINDTVFIEVDEIENPKQTIHDPRNPDLKLGKKGKLSWVGEKCHVVETAEKGKVNFIVDVVAQESNASDHKILSEIKGNNEKRRLEPEKTFVDGNYVSGTAIREYREKGQELMGYIQRDNSKRDEEFKTEKFKIDMEKQEAVCPEGCRNISWKVNEKYKTCVIRFSTKDCSKCDKFQKCVTAGQRCRTLTVSRDYQFIKERREIQKTDEFKKEMKVRAQIEGTISELTRFHGFRNIKYKGRKGRRQQYYFAACAVNLKRFCKMPVSL